MESDFDGIIKMKFDPERVRTLRDMRGFIAAYAAFDIRPEFQHEGDQMIEETLRKCRYETLGKADKGVVRAYLLKVSGRSRATIAARRTSPGPRSEEV